jgi:hypothetical protein
MRAALAPIFAGRSGAPMRAQLNALSAPNRDLELSARPRGFGRAGGPEGNPLRSRLGGKGRRPSNLSKTPRRVSTA